MELFQNCVSLLCCEEASYGTLPKLCVSALLWRSKLWNSSKTVCLCFAVKKQAMGLFQNCVSLLCCEEASYGTLPKLCVSTLLWRSKQWNSSKTVCLCFAVKKQAMELFQNCVSLLCCEEASYGTLPKLCVSTLLWRSKLWDSSKTVCLYFAVKKQAMELFQNCVSLFCCEEASYGTLPKLCVSTLLWRSKLWNFVFFAVTLLRVRVFPSSSSLRVMLDVSVLGAFLVLIKTSSPFFEPLMTAWIHQNRLAQGSLHHTNNCTSSETIPHVSRMWQQMMPNGSQKSAAKTMKSVWLEL